MPSQHLLHEDRRVATENWALRLTDLGHHCRWIHQKNALNCSAPFLVAWFELRGTVLAEAPVHQ